MAPTENWARAYARQALSDLRVRETLVAARAGQVDRCHQLHFLQMAAEKVCKAHLSAANGNRDVKRTHAYVAKILPILAKAFYTRLDGQGSLTSWQSGQIRRLAEEIELLAPACNADEARNDNSEYPWLDAKGIVQIPCEYKFGNIDDRDKGVVLTIRLLRAAATAYAD